MRGFLFSRNFEAMFREKVTDNLLSAMCKALRTTMTVAQGDAIRFITAECDAAGVTDARMVAYILGTCYNECRFKSIPEIRAKKGSMVWDLQQRYWHTGYYGRGYSQLTWESNYRKFGDLLGIDLVGKPDLALMPAIGAKILVKGMVGGLFTGKALRHYFSDTKADWMGARLIVNGKLKGQKYGFMAKECAAAAMKIHAIIV